jgi:hypothetical protein
VNNSDNSKNCHKIYPYNPIIDNLVKVADNQSRPSRVSERHVYTGRTNETITHSLTVVISII